MILYLLPLLALTPTLLAQPINHRSTITASSILSIDPTTSTCTNAPYANECRTANQAAPYVAISFTNFGITSFNTQAALLALMLYESGSFKYVLNHYPGVAGQGTRNMQSADYNLKYAEWLSGVCKNCGITDGQVKTAQANGPAAVLELVNGDQWGFGSAAWFLSTQCSQSVRVGLAEGTQEGWGAYLGCVGTEVNEERNALWSKTIALKGW